MQAARLKDRISVEEERRVANGQGGWTGAGWSTIPGAESVPAEVTAMSGDEALRLGIERSTQQYRVRIRRRASLAVTPKNRLKWRSSANETMAVKSVLPDPREPKAFLVLIVEVGNGS